MKTQKHRGLIGMSAVLVCVLMAAAPANAQDVLYEDEIILRSGAPIVGVSIVEDSWKQVVGTIW